MKKLFYFFLILPLGLFAQTQVINVGTTANDGTGDPIRTAFQKVNTNRAATVDSFAVHNGVIQAIKYDSLPNKYTKAQTRTLIGDTVDARLAAATDLETYIDTRLENFEGGGAVGMYELRGIVGTTSGFPGNGDSLIINTGFVNHPHIQVYRDGVMQWLVNSNANNTDSYKFNSTTGTVTVKPVFSTSEKVIVHAYDPVVWHDLIPEGGTGGGGGSGESNLLTDLVAFWQLNETTGTLINDALGTYNGTATSVVLGGSGKFGTSATFDASTDLISMGNSGFELDSLSFSVWIKTTGTPDDTKGILSKRFYSPNRGFSLVEGTGGDLGFYIFHSTQGYASVFTEATINDNQWHNVVCTYDGANLRIYIDGVEDSYSPEPWTYFPDYYAGNTPLYIGNTVYGEDAFIGSIDAVGIWHHVLREGTKGVNQITDLQTKTYPFN